MGVIPLRRKSPPRLFSPGKERETGFGHNRQPPKKLLTIIEQTPLRDIGNSGQPVGAKTGGRKQPISPHSVLT